MTNPVLSDDEVASLIAEVEREQKAREFDCCAYQSKSGKTGCGALRYYHERVKSHEFVEPEHTLSNKAKMLALFNQNTALREQLAAVESARDQLSDGLSVRDAQLTELRAQLAQVTQERQICAKCGERIQK